MSMLSASPRLAATTRFVAHGSLYVAKSIDPAFRQAEAYLRGDSVMRRTFDDLETGPDVHFVVGNAHGDDHYSDGAREIAWDPHSALRTTAGGAQSPALGLGHECAHADEVASERATLAQIHDVAYDNKEERRVIRGAEAHAARTLGEATRSDHRGELFYVDSPVVYA